MKNILFFILSTFSVLFAQTPDLIVQLGHSDGVNSVNFDPGGHTVLSCSPRSVKLWDLRTQKLVGTLPEGGHRAVFVEGDKYVAFITADKAGDKIVVYESATGKKQREIPVPEGIEVWALSPDGKTAATGDNKGNIKLINFADGKTLATFQAHPEPMKALAFSPDGLTLVSGSEERADITPEGSSLKIWETASQKLRLKIPSAHTDWILSLVFSPDGKTIASASFDFGIKTWEAATGKLLNQMKGHTMPVNQIVFSPDGTRLASASGYTTASFGKYDCSIRLWEVKTGEMLFKATGHQDFILATAFSPDGQYLLSGSRDGLVKLWDAGNAKELGVFKGFSASVSDVAFSPDGKYLGVSAGQFLADGTLEKKVFGIKGHQESDNSIKLFDCATGVLAHNLVFHKNDVNDFAFSPDGQYLSTVSDDKTAVLWESGAGRIYKVFERNSPGELYSTAISRDNALIAIGDEDGGAKIYSRETQRLIRKIKPGDGMDWVRALEYSPSGKYLAAACNQSVKLFDSGSDKLLNTLSGPNELVTAIVFHPTKDWLLVAWEGGGLWLWDAANGKILKKTDTGQTRANGLAFGPGGKLFASAGDDRSVKLWDFEEFAPLHTFWGHQDRAKSVSFHPSGNFLASGGADTQVKIWDLEKRAEHISIIGLPGYEYIITSPEGYYHATKGAFQSVGFRQGLKSYPFEQFDLKLNRPDIILKKMGEIAYQGQLENPNSNLVKSFYAAYQKRLERMKFSETDLDGSTGGPIVALLSKPDVTTKESVISIKIKVSDEKHHLERFNLFVNDVPVYGRDGMDLKKLKSNIFEHQAQVALSNGDNKIQMSAHNTKGVESFRETVYVHKEASGKKNLHLVVIGVSEFADTEMNLTYAAKDAMDIAEAFKKADLYGEVKVYPLLNKDAVKSKIISVKDRLAGTGIDDNVLLFVSSHGVLAKDMGFYIATHDMDFGKPEEKGLAYNELEHLLDGIPARNKALFIDACHSGELDKESIILPAEAKIETGDVAFKGFKARGDRTKQIELSSSFELMKDVFADLRKGTGATVISAAGGGEYALEGEGWANGVFTYCLLKGLKNAEADQDLDGQISIQELKSYIYEKVPLLTKGKQNPTSRMENMSNNFRVW